MPVVEKYLARALRHASADEVVHPQLHDNDGTALPPRHS